MGHAQFAPGGRGEGDAMLDGVDAGIYKVKNEWVLLTDCVRHCRSLGDGRFGLKSVECDGAGILVLQAL